MDDDDNNNNDARMPTYPPRFVTEPKGYALSGKIMLTAIIILFAVVLIMVCFHIYARWYILRARRRNLRRARRRTHLVFYIDSSLPPSSSSSLHSSSRGLDPSVIKSLPTFTYSTRHRHRTSVSTSTTSNHDHHDDRVSEAVECAVCLSEFQEGEMGRMLPKCSHCFHVECIDMWFHSHDTCPLCRAPVDPTDLDKEKKEEDEEQPPPPSQLAELDPRKGVELPRRTQSFSFGNSDESGTSRSPASRLKRFWSGAKRSPTGSGGAELDVELGGG
ncbi:hypothetical protein vseg_012222 [Gypsophila vaccaria]